MTGGSATGRRAGASATKCRAGASAFAKEALLDLARGVPLADGVRLAVETHVQACTACAADLEHHRDLTAALRALSADAQGWTASPEIEQRLQAAFEAGRAASAPPSEAQPQTERWVYALAIAALVFLAAWIGSRALRPPTAAPATAAAPASAVTPASGPPLLSVPASAAVVPAEPATVSKPRRLRRIATPVPRVRSIEFMALLSAVGLPDFESGRVVRMQVPVAALPGYGVEIVPDAAKTTVEADVLVGQDGQPRAIRLVTADEQSTGDVRSRP